MAVKICNKELFNGKQMDNGKNKYTPNHIYCFKPLSKIIDNILARLSYQWFPRETTGLALQLGIAVKFGTLLTPSAIL